MDKKDIYEHLAKIYLDASEKRKKKSKKHYQYKNILLVALAFFAGAGFFFAGGRLKNKALATEFALIIQPDVAKINFNFDPARKEIFSINLNNLNASRFRSLSFLVKKANYANKINLRVEFTNGFKEKFAVYLTDIPDYWKEYRISLRSFKGISDWTGMLNLSFIVEDWNTQKNHGVVYVDNVALLR